MKKFLSLAQHIHILIHTPIPNGILCKRKSLFQLPFRYSYHFWSTIVNILCTHIRILYIFLLYAYKYTVYVWLVVCLNCFMIWLFKRYCNRCKALLNKVSSFKWIAAINGILILIKYIMWIFIFRISAGCSYIVAAICFKSLNNKKLYFIGSTFLNNPKISFWKILRL